MAIARLQWRRCVWHSYDIISPLVLLMFQFGFMCQPRSARAQCARDLNGAVSPDFWQTENPDDVVW